MTGWLGLLRFSSSICLAMAVIAGVRTGWGAELDWQAVPGCPERDVVEHRVRIAIGMPLEQAGNNRFACVVTQSPKGSYRLELRVEVPTAKASERPRIIEAATCDQVTDTAVIAIALALGANSAEPSALAPELPASEAVPRHVAAKLSATSKTKEVAASAANPSGPAASSAPASRSHPWVGAQFGAIIDAGSLPGLAIALEPAFDLGYRAVLARLSGTIFAEQRKTLPDGSGGEFSLWSAALTVCGSTPRDHSHARLCAGAEAGKLTGRGYGSAVVRQASAIWFAPKLQLELVSEPWFFGLRGVVGGVAGMPLTRRPFTFGTTDQVHRAGTIVGRLSVGLEIDWE